MPLTEHDKTLLIETLCCVVAADGRVSGSEIAVIAEALTQAGCPTTREEIRPLVIEMSKQIHVRDVRRYADRLATQLSGLRNTSVGAVLQKSLVTLVAADGKDTEPETEIVRRFRRAIAGALPLPNERLHDASVGGVGGQRPKRQRLNSDGAAVRWLVAATRPLFTAVGRFLIGVGVVVMALPWLGGPNMRMGVSTSSKETPPAATDAMPLNDVQPSSDDSVRSIEAAATMNNKRSIDQQNIDANERHASQAWASGRDKQFQQWADSLAKQREAMDRASYDLEANAHDLSLAEQSARGRARIGVFRPWVPTYAKWYRHYLEGFRNVCGAMSKEELRRFAQQQELEWGGY